MSLPVCFLNYRILPKAALKDLRVEFCAEERIAFNTCFDPERSAATRAGVWKTERFEVVYMSLLRQMPMSQSSDEFGADWGTWYLTGQSCCSRSEGGRRLMCAENVHDCSDDKKTVSGRFLFGFDDLVSIFYFGEWLKGFWFRNGKTILDALNYAWDEYPGIREICDRFDERLCRDAEPFGEDYLLLLRAALRQSVGAHKLVEDSRGRLLFLSKECNSDGCIATADVSYPSMPLYLYYAPELVVGMIRPILDFAEMPVWEFDFAPHDAGVYPFCLGQLYAVENSEDKYCPEAYMQDWGKMESLPFYYLFPSGTGVYGTERQMPVEECGNVILLAAAAVRAGADAEFVREHFGLFRKWVRYLIDKGLVPANQLCTDDFAGHLDKNANLSVKAIVGIAAFAELCDMAGEREVAERCRETARRYAGEWERMCVREGHSALTMDGDAATFSLKYNLAMDKLFGFGLFRQSLLEEEVDYYLTKCGRFGIPLDSRQSYGKSDWNLWAASMTDRAEKRERILRCSADFLRESPDRVPYSDWYETEEGSHHLFRNRTVQGAHFILLLQRAWNQQ